MGLFGKVSGVVNRAMDSRRQPNVTRPTVTNGLSAVNSAPYGRDEWGGAVSKAKFEGDARARDMVAASKQAGAEAAARFAKIDAYKASPEGKAAEAKRETERVANLGSNSVEGQTGSGGYTMSVGNNPIRRQE